MKNPLLLKYFVLNSFILNIYSFSFSEPNYYKHPNFNFSASGKELLFKDKSYLSEVIPEPELDPNAPIRPTRGFHTFGFLLANPWNNSKITINLGTMLEQGLWISGSESYPASDSSDSEQPLLENWFMHYDASIGASLNNFDLSKSSLDFNPRIGILYNLSSIPIHGLGLLLGGHGSYYFNNQDFVIRFGPSFLVNFFSNINLNIGYYFAPFNRSTGRIDDGLAFISADIYINSFK
jgi:hypothetical protein